jgi:glycosyltransferase involved in cell wall biosynthesis
MTLRGIDKLVITSPMISVIVCTYNRSAMLRDTLASLAQMTLPANLGWELLVVDNNSNDDTRHEAEAFAQRSGLNVRHLFEPRPGKSFALNTGIKEAKGELLAFTDDDITVDTHWLVEISKAFEEHNCLAVGGRILPVWHAPKPHWFYEERPFSLRAVSVHYDLGEDACEATIPPFGANMAFRRIAFNRYGLFRTDLGPCGSVKMPGEESELFQRLSRAKEKVVYAPKAIVYHPVPKERLQKAYAQSLFYNAGKTEFRVSGVPQGAVCYFGVPRFLFRMISDSFFAWTFSLEPKRRFRNKLRMYHAVGMIAESRTQFAAQNAALNGARRS